MVNTFIYAILLSYAALFPVLNPLGASLLFHSITFPLPQKVKARLARKIALNAFILLTGVLILGSYVLKIFGISIPIVQLAGGAVVATRGWMIMNTGVRANSVGPTEIISDEKVAFGSAFFPLTLPMSAGPGSIATAITLGAGAGGLPDKVSRLINYGGLVAGVFFSALTVYFAYHFAGYLMKRLGDNGRIVIMKLSSFITLCIGLTIVWKGVQGLIAFYIH
jgi:multiple antibiotic resistance protein